jgi:hypothetical protein
LPFRIALRGRAHPWPVRRAGRFTPVHDAWWAAACKAHGDTAGTRALIEVLLLHRHLAHDHVVVGLAAALRAGALTADTVALEARKAADDTTDDNLTNAATDVWDSTTDTGAPASAPGPMSSMSTPVTSLTEHRLARLPPDTRPLPSGSCTRPRTTRSSPGCTPRACAGSSRCAVPVPEHRTSPTSSSRRARSSGACGTTTRSESDPTTSNASSTPSSVRWN